MSGQLVGKRDVLQGIQVLVDLCARVMNLRAWKFFQNSQQEPMASSLKASIQCSLCNWDIRIKVLIKVILLWKDSSFAPDSGENTVQEHWEEA